MNEELVRCGITFRQCQVLAWLAMEGDTSQVHLADCMRIEPPTLVRILDRMERDGLVERVDCAGDRRKKIIRALPKAEPVWEKIIECGDRVREKAEAGLSSKEIAKLNQLLETVQSNLIGCVGSFAKSKAL